MKKCKECGGKMILKVNRKTGHKFWGCENYPSCTYTQQKKEYIIGAQCPVCGAPLERKINRRSTNTFLSCSTYPSCKWSRPDTGEPGVILGTRAANVYLQEPEIRNKLKKFIGMTYEEYKKASK